MVFLSYGLFFFIIFNYVHVSAGAHGGQDIGTP